MVVFLLAQASDNDSQSSFVLLLFIHHLLLCPAVAFALEQAAKPQR